MTTRQTTTYEPSSDVVFTPLDDGEGVLLHLLTREYYTLNESGVRIWELLAEGENVDAITDALNKGDTGTVDEARRFVAEYVEELLKEGLVVVKGD
jgi:hypothetical protein